MFARSLDIVDECGLTHLHVFPFSPRPGTPAARMPQVLARTVVKERARRLREKARRRCAATSIAEFGARRNVLAETEPASGAPKDSRWCASMRRFALAISARSTSPAIMGGSCSPREMPGAGRVRLTRKLRQ